MLRPRREEECLKMIKRRRASRSRHYVQMLVGRMRPCQPPSAIQRTKTPTTVLHQRKSNRVPQRRHTRACCVAFEATKRERFRAAARKEAPPQTGVLRPPLPLSLCFNFTSDCTVVVRARAHARLTRGSGTDACRRRRRSRRHTSARLRRARARHRQWRQTARRSAPTPRPRPRQCPSSTPY